MKPSKHVKSVKQKAKKPFEKKKVKLQQKKNAFRSSTFVVVMLLRVRRALLCHVLPP